MANGNGKETRGNGKKSSGSGVGSDAANIGTGAFDFEKFNENLEEQRQRISKRQEAQQQHAARTTQAAEKSAKLNRDYLKDTKPLVKSIQTSQAKADHARGLADSGNPLDTLRLIALQHSDPAGYTRKTRNARLQEDLQRAGAVAQVYGIRQEAVESELIASAAQVDEEKVAETIGLEKLKRVQEEAAIAKDNLSAHLTFQEVSLHGLDEEQLGKAAQAAETSPTGTTKINGVDVETESIRDRIAALQERRYERRKAAYDAALKEAEIQDVDQTIATKRAQRALDYQDVIDAGHEKEARTYDLTELQEIQDNNYVDDAGKVWKPETIDSMVERRQQIHNERIERETARSRLGSLDDDTLIAAKTRVERLESTLPETGPARRQIGAYRTAVGIAATKSGKENDDLTRIEGQAIFDKATEDLESAIDKQVESETGDKDLQRVLKSYYMGNPLPAEDLENALSTRLRKHQSLGDVLPQGLATRISARYKKRYAELLAQDTSNLDQLQDEEGNVSNEAAQQWLRGGGGSGTTAEDRKLLQERAIQESVEWGTKQYTQERSTEIIKGQVRHSKHPLHERWSANQMGTVTENADNAALQSWMRDHQLTPDQAKTIIDDGIMPRGVEGDHGALENDLIHRENQELIMSLESEERGLGQKVANWWTEYGAQYLKQNQDKTSRNAGSFKEAAVRSISSAMERTSIENYGMGFAAANDAVVGEHARRTSEFITFGANPEYAQAAILNADKNLAPHEKARVFQEVIQPLVAQATTNGNNFQDTNRLVEQALMQAQPEDKELQRILKTMNRDRARIIETYETWAGAAREYPVGPGPRRTGPERPPGPNKVGTIDWYSNLKREQGNR